MLIVLSRLTRLWVLLTVLSTTSVLSSSLLNAQTSAFFDDSSKSWLAPEIAEIKKRGYLRVGMHSIDQPPFIVTVGDETQGTDVDLAAGIASVLGVKLRLNRDAKSFNAVVDLLSQGKVDLAISKLSRTGSRSLKTIASDPYLTFRQGLLVNRVEFTKIQKQRTVVATIQSFNGSIGIIAGTAWKNRAAKHFPNAQLYEFETWERVVQAVVSGEVAIAYRDEFEVKKIISQDPSFSITLKTIIIEDLLDTLGIFSAIENPNLAHFVDMYLELYYKEIGIKDLLVRLSEFNQTEVK